MAKMTRTEAAKLFQEMGDQIPENLLREEAEETTRKRGRPKRIGGSENAGSDEAPASTGRETKQIKEIRVGLTALLMGSGKLISNFNQFDGFVIQAGSPALVDAFCRAAQQNAWLRGYLLSLVHVSAWGDITMAAAMIAIPILANHNMLPFSMDFLASSMAVEQPKQENNLNGYQAATMA